MSVRPMWNADSKTDLETILLPGVTFAVAFHGLKTQRKRRKSVKRCHRWWVRSWTRDGIESTDVNTTYKLQRQLAVVSSLFQHVQGEERAEKAINRSIDQLKKLP